MFAIYKLPIIDFLQSFLCTIILTIQSITELSMLVEQQIKTNTYRCHYPLITYLTLSSFLYFGNKKAAFVASYCFVIH